MLAFPEPGVDDIAAYQGYQTRFFRDSRGNVLQVYLDPRGGRVVNLWADAFNESIGFTVRDATGRPARLMWGSEGATVTDSGMHRTVEYDLRLTDLVDRTDVRMLKQRGGTCLVEEASLGRCVETALREQELERDGPAKAEVLGAVDHAHASGAQRLHDAEVRNSTPCEPERVGRAVGVSRRLLRSHGIVSLTVIIKSGAQRLGSHPRYRTHR